MVVHLDHAARAHLDAHVLEAETLRVGHAAGGDEHDVRLHLLGVAALDLLRVRARARVRVRVRVRVTVRVRARARARARVRVGVRVRVRDRVRVRVRVRVGALDRLYGERRAAAGVDLGAHDLG